MQFTKEQKYGLQAERQMNINVTREKEMFVNKYNFNLWFKKVNITYTQNKSLCYDFSNKKDMHRKHDAF